MQFIAIDLALRAFFIARDFRVNPTTGEIEAEDEQSFEALLTEALRIGGIKIGRNNVFASNGLEVSVGGNVYLVPLMGPG